MLALFTLSLSAQLALILLSLMAVDAIAFAASKYLDNYSQPKPHPNRQLYRPARAEVKQ